MSARACGFKSHPEQNKGEHVTKKEQDQIISSKLNFAGRLFVSAMILLICGGFVRFYYDSFYISSPGREFLILILVTATVPVVVLFIIGAIFSILGIISWFLWVLEGKPIKENFINLWDKIIHTISFAFKWVFGNWRKGALNGKTQRSRSK